MNWGWDFFKKGRAVQWRATHKIAISEMVGEEGFEPPKCCLQRAVPYHLATPHQELSGPLYLFDICHSIK